MSLSQPRAVFGIHSFTPYKLSDGLPYGIAKVLGEASFSLQGETQELRGGSSKFPWEIEDGNISSELSIKLREYPNWLFEIFLGKAPTVNAAETAGNISTPVNKKGTSCMDAVTGIDSISVIATTGAASLKTGKYVIKVISATTVKIVCLSDIDFNRGTDAAFADDDLFVTAAALTVTSGDDTEVADLGLQITGGSGAIALVAGDTATFEVRAVNTSSMTVRVGGVSDTFPTFGALIYSALKGDGRLFEIDVFRMKAIGAPLPLSEKAFSEAELKAKAFYDSAKNGVFDVREVVAA